MSLAAILGLCALLASPQGTSTIQAVMLWQETQPQQPSSEPGLLPEQHATPDQALPEPQRTLEQGTKPEQTAPQHSPPESTQPPESAPPTTVPEKSDCSSSASKGKKRNSKHKVAVQAASGPKKTVVRNGGTADPGVQLGPSVTDQQASQQRQSTAQLLAATDANLNKISARQLTSSQQDMVNQIHTYMQQAKTAESAGDLQRARNLAFKAQLLSDEVLRH
jgi:hypothetical protein